MLAFARGLCYPLTDVTVNTGVGLEGTTQICEGVNLLHIFSDSYLDLLILSIASDGKGFCFWYRTLILSAHF